MTLLSLRYFSPYVCHARVTCHVETVQNINTVCSIRYRFLVAKIHGLRFKGSLQITASKWGTRQSKLGILTNTPS